MSKKYRTYLLDKKESRLTVWMVTFEGNLEPFELIGLYQKYQDSIVAADAYVSLHPSSYDCINIIEVEVQ